MRFLNCKSPSPTRLRENNLGSIFLWRTTDGRIIVGELDGTAKYVDPKMTDRRSIQETVQAEREREQALFRAGVTKIVRLTFDDAVQQKPLIAKLRRAGVPCVS